MSADRGIKDAGYTLIELLVVILLLGFIALAIGGGVHFGTRVWDVSEERIAADAQLVRAQSILRTILGAALPRKEAGFVTFEGTPERISFDAVAVPALGTPGVAHVELEIVRNGIDRQLRLRARAVGARSATKETVLATHLTGVQFSFLDSASALPVWLASWRDRQRLPDAVRVADTTSLSTSGWPYFVARLPIAQTAQCAFDPVSYVCR